MKNFIDDFKNKFYPAGDLASQICDALKKQYGFSLDIKRVRIKEKSIRIFLPTSASHQDNGYMTQALEKEFPEYNFAIINDVVGEAPQKPQHVTTPRPKIQKPTFGKHGSSKKVNRDTIKYILAVASGKGGVGKSTVSLNLARALQKKGYKTGLIDADIHGPSVPVMTGGYSMAEYEDHKIKPKIIDDLKVMSIGYMVDPAKPVVWRGPLVSGAIQQMFQDVAWGEIDIMVVDMPPGTGDAQLTLCQSVVPDGTVIVSTPQMTSVIDAERCAMMFERMKTPIIGVIENMRGFIAPDTGKEYLIFGQGGAEDFAKTYKYPYLGHLPIQMEVAFLSDTGKALYDQDNLQKITDLFEGFAEQIMINLKAKKKVADE
ncbi:MAG: Mrp/NBP35 family ATP-binding protein [Pseudomonadota bacterium]